ncbi:MAG: DUF4837 family protein [Porphyromonas sp.]|nr:DUF4837 family protein [Porphyromonas sp.]
MSNKRYSKPLTMIATLLLLALTAGSLSSCKGGGKSRNPLGASGRPLSLMVVLPDQYDSEALRDSVRRAFSQALPILPQPEPALDVMFTTHSRFTSMFRSQRNILYISIDPERYTGPSISVSRNDYALGQILLHAKAESEESVYTILRLRNDSMIRTVFDEEVERRLVVLNETFSSAFARAVEEQVGGVTVNAPVELEFIQTGDHFVWGSNMAQENRMDFVVYSFPFRDKETFTRDYLIHKRDSVLGRQIKGQFPGSRMMTETMLMPVFSAKEYKGAYRAELRGLWAMTNDMMGGPFVMHAIVKGDKSEVVVAEAFVYNPSGKKRNLLLYDESALYTLRLEGADYWSHSIDKTSK